MKIDPLRVLKHGLRTTRKRKHRSSNEDRPVEGSETAKYDGDRARNAMVPMKIDPLRVLKHRCAVFVNLYNEVPMKIDPLRVLKPTYVIYRQHLRRVPMKIDPLRVLKPMTRRGRVVAHTRSNEDRPVEGSETPNASLALDEP